MAACLNTEIRKLKPGELYMLGYILNVSSAWKKLMVLVRKEGNVPKFSSEHIKIVEQAAVQSNRTEAEIFLDEWSTMGRRRPTLEVLLQLLVEAELFRAADYIACDILKQERPKRPNSGPAAPIDISDAAIKKLLQEQQMLQDNTIVDSEILKSATEQEIDKMFFKAKTVELFEAVNQNLPDTLPDDSSNCKTIDVSNEIISDLMKFGISDTTDSIKSDLMKFSISDTTDKNETENGVSCTLTMAPEQLPSSINNENKTSKLLEGPYYQEMPSQELPIFLNNCISYH